VIADEGLELAKQVTALAALFECDVSIDWIQELTGLKASQIILGVEHGIEQGLFSKKGPGIFCFKNNKKRKDLIDSTDPENLQRLHRLIADILLRDVVDEKSAVRHISKHLLQIPNDLEDCRWLLKAGELYRREYDPKQAMQCYAKVISSLGQVDDVEEDWLFVEAAIGISKVSETESELELVISDLRQALAKANNRGNESQQALLEMHMAKTEWLRSNYDDALMHFDRGWSLSNEVNDPKFRRSALTFSTFFPFWQGRYSQVIKNYEEFAPAVEKYAQGRFPLLAAHLIGNCYLFIGQITQGMGMLNSLWTHCREKGDFYVASFSGLSIGSMLLEIGRIEESIQTLNAALDDSNRAPLTMVKILILLNLGLAYFEKKDNEKAIDMLNTYLKTKKKVETGGNHLPLLMSYCWAMEQGKLPRVAGLSLEKEIGQALYSKNVFFKGVAHRYQARLTRQTKQSREKVIELLHLSEKFLEESGHQLETARTRIELSREYLSLGREKKAKQTVMKSAEIIKGYIDHQFPEDLRFLMHDFRTEKTLLSEIMKLAQELVAIREENDLLPYIISAVNRIIGTERGAVFLLEDNAGCSPIALRAAKNLTPEDISSPGFAASMKLIEKVAETGRGETLTTDSTDCGGPFSDDAILFRICVPMKFRDKVVGVLYFDNRLFINSFKESDIEILDYFAALAAIAMDNSRAHTVMLASNLKLMEEKQYYEEQQRESLGFEEFVGRSPAVVKVMEQVRQVAGTEAAVLILGETGVGKELIARAIHSNSHRHSNAFIRVNCSTLPDTLIASELFGHEKGSFTGADKLRIGRFELADQGTLFLDEVGEIPLNIQVRLLRVLQSKEFERVGGKKTLRSDFRLVAATNRDLQQAVKKGLFREDLFYRLNVFPISIPPLRERKEDIPLLANYFHKLYADKLGKTMEKLPDTDINKLLNYDWPGNVRELENIIERGMILSSAHRFVMPELNPAYQEIGGDRQSVTLDENEREHILWMLKKTNGKIRGRGGAAELLDIHPNTLYSRMKRLGIRRQSNI
jgi:formate hydrogenlyase transcriptional activator